MTADLDEAVAWAEAAKAAREAVSIGLVGNTAEVFPELLGAGSPPTSSPTRPARTIRSAGTCPRACRCPRPRRCGASPMSTSHRSYASMARQVDAMVGFAEAGSVVFDYGNNLRAGAVEGGLDHDRAYSFPGFVPAFVRPLFCEGKGPFRWVALSGDPADIAATDRAVAELFPDERPPAPLARRWPANGGLPGAARPDLLAGLRRARSRRRAVQRDGGLGRGVRPRS